MNRLLYSLSFKLTTSLLFQHPPKSLYPYAYALARSTLCILQRVPIYSPCSDVGPLFSISHSGHTWWGRDSWKMVCIQVRGPLLSELAARLEPNSMHPLRKTQLLWGAPSQLLTEYSSSSEVALCLSALDSSSCSLVLLGLLRTSL